MGRDSESLKRDVGALFGAMEVVRRRGFDWSSRNCALGAFSIHAAFCGRDFAARYRGRMSGPLSAMRLLKREGGLVGVLGRLGFVRISRGMACRGDLAVFRWRHEGRSEREALGVVVDSRAAFQGPGDWEFKRLGECDSFWRPAAG